MKQRASYDAHYMALAEIPGCELCAGGGKS